MTDGRNVKMLNEMNVEKSRAKDHQGDVEYGDSKLAADSADFIEGVSTIEQQSSLQSALQIKKTSIEYEEIGAQGQRGDAETNASKQSDLRKETSEINQSNKQLGQTKDTDVCDTGKGKTEDTNDKQKMDLSFEKDQTDKVAVESSSEKGQTDKIAIESSSEKGQTNKEAMESSSEKGQTDKEAVVEMELVSEQSQTDKVATTSTYQDNMNTQDQSKTNQGQESNNLKGIKSDQTEGVAEDLIEATHKSKESESSKSIKSLDEADDRDKSGKGKPDESKTQEQDTSGKRKTDTGDDSNVETLESSKQESIQIKDDRKTTKTLDNVDEKAQLQAMRTVSNENIQSATDKSSVSKSIKQKERIETYSDELEGIVFVTSRHGASSDEEDSSLQEASVESVQTSFKSVKSSEKLRKEMKVCSASEAAVESVQSSFESVQSSDKFRKEMKLCAANEGEDGGPRFAQPLDERLDVIDDTQPVVPNIINVMDNWKQNTVRVEDTSLTNELKRKGLTTKFISGENFEETNVSDIVDSGGLFVTAPVEMKMATSLMAPDGEPILVEEETTIKESTEIVEKETGEKIVEEQMLSTSTKTEEQVPDLQKLDQLKPQVSVLLESSDVTVMVGHSFILKWKISGASWSVADIYKDGKQVKSDSNLIVNVTEDVCMVIVEKATLDHTAVWTVGLPNIEPNLGKVKVTVAESKPLDKSIEVLVEKDNVDVKEGDRLQLRWKIEGGSWSTACLYKDDVKLTATDKVAIKITDPVCTLRVQPSAVDDAGAYSVRVEGVEKALGVVKVTVTTDKKSEEPIKPKVEVLIDNEQINVKEGESFQLKWKITGTSWSSASIYKDGKKITSTDTLVIKVIEDVCLLSVDKSLLDNGGVYSVKIPEVEETLGVVKVTVSTSTKKQEEKIKQKINIHVNNDKVDVSEGESFQMTWKITGTSWSSTSIYKDGKKITANENLKIKITEDVCTLSVDKSMVGDSGVYAVKIAEVEETHGSVKVNVKKSKEPIKPTIEVLMDQVAVSEGESFQLKWKITGTSWSSTSIYKDGKQITTKEGWTMKVTEDVCTLIVDKSLVADSGVYSVNIAEVEETLGSVKVNVSTENRKSKSPTKSTIEVLMDSDHVSVSEGETFQLKWKITGEDWSVANITKNGQKISTDDRVTVDVTGEVCTLTVNKAIVSDGTTYGVMLANSESVLGSVTVSVTSKQSKQDKKKREQEVGVLVDNIIATEGETVELKWNISGTKVTTQNIYKGDQRLETDSNIHVDITNDVCTLRIDKASVSDSSVYSMMFGETRKGEITVKVTTEEQSKKEPVDDKLEEVVYALMDNRNIDVREGDAFSMKWKITGADWSKATFYKDDKKVSLTDGDLLVQKADDVCTLSCVAAVQSDTAIYSVMLENSTQKQGEIFVDVITEERRSPTEESLKPTAYVLTDNRNIQAVEGESFQLKWKITGSDWKNVGIYKDGEKLQPSDNIHINISEDVCTLIVDHASLADDADYTIRLDKTGQDQGEVIVNVSTSTEEKSKLKVEETTVSIDADTTTDANKSLELTVDTDVDNQKSSKDKDTDTMAIGVDTSTEEGKLTMEVDVDTSKSADEGKSLAVTVETIEEASKVEEKTLALKVETDVDTSKLSTAVSTDEEISLATSVDVDSSKTSALTIATDVETSSSAAETLAVSVDTAVDTNVEQTGQMDVTVKTDMKQTSDEQIPCDDVMEKAEVKKDEQKIPAPKEPETKTDQAKKDEVKEEVKEDEVKKDEVKKDEKKIPEPKKPEVKEPEPKKDEVKEVKEDEVKKDEVKKDEKKIPEPKIPEVKEPEPKKDEVKEVKEDEVKKDEVKKDEKKIPEPKKPEVKEPEPKKDEVKEVKEDEVKKDQLKKDEKKIPEPKKPEVKEPEPKKDEVKEVKEDEVLKDEVKKDEKKIPEPKKPEPKKDEVKEEVKEDEVKKDEVKKDEQKKPEEVKPEITTKVTAEVTTTTEVKEEVKPEVKAEVTTTTEVTGEVKPEVKAEVSTTTEVKEEVKPEVKAEVTTTTEVTGEVKPEVKAEMTTTTEVKEEIKPEVKAEVTTTTEVKEEVQPEVKAEVTTTTEVKEEVKPEVKAEVKTDVTTTTEVKEEVKPEVMAEVTTTTEVKEEVKPEVKPEVKAEVKTEVTTTTEVKEEVKPEVKAEVTTETKEEVKAEVSVGVSEDVKTEVKEQVKVDVTTEVKEEVTAKAKVEVTTDVSVESKTEVSAEVTTEVKEEVITGVSTDVSVESKQESKAEVTTDVSSEVNVEATKGVEADFSVDVKEEIKTDVKEEVTQEVTIHDTPAEEELIDEENITVFEGESFQVEWQIEGNCTKLPYIYKDEERVLEDAYVTIEMIDDSYTLSVETAEVTDSGIYSLRFGDNGRSQGEIIVLVKSSPENQVALNEEPRFVREPAIEVKNGRRLSIKCSFTGFPVPNVTWYHEGQALMPDALWDVYSQDGYHYLEARNSMTLMNSKEIVCRLDNDIGFVHRVVSVKRDGDEVYCERVYAPVETDPLGEPNQPPYIDLEVSEINTKNLRKVKMVVEYTDSINMVTMEADSEIDVVACVWDDNILARNHPDHEKMCYIPKQTLAIFGDVSRTVCQQSGEQIASVTQENTDNSEDTTMPERRKMKSPSPKMTSTPKVKRRETEEDTTELQKRLGYPDGPNSRKEFSSPGDSVELSTEYNDGTTRPMFKKRLKSVQAKSGEMAQLECQVSGNPLPKILWLKNNRPLKASDGCKVIVDDSTNILVFPQARDEDAGIYTARAMNVNGSIMCSAEFSLSDGEGQAAVPSTDSPLDLDFTTPAYFFQMSSCEVSEGRLARFDCRVVAYPRPEIVWMRDGKVIDVDVRFKLLNFNNEIYSLLIQDVRIEDTGRYTCWARNKFGEAMTEAYLNVKVLSDDEDEGDLAPKFLTRFYDQQTTEGTMTGFKCLIAGRPEPSVTWLLDDIEIHDSPGIRMKHKDGMASLEIKSPKVEQSGNYTCHLSNTAGEATCSAKLTVVEDKLHGRMLPKFIKKFDHITGKDGEEVRFAAVIVGEPRPDVMWLYDHKPISDTNRRFIAKEDGDAYTLIIKNLRFDDAGKITCKAVNSEGEVYCSANLNVREGKFLRDTQDGTKDEVDAKFGYIPTFTKRLQDLQVTEGSRAMFECKVMGIPDPEISWMKDGRVITPGGRFRMSYQNGTGQLTIENVSATDTGVYTCIISNSQGKSSSTAALKLEDTTKKDMYKPEKKEERLSRKDRFSPEKYSLDDAPAARPKRPYLDTDKKKYDVSPKKSYDRSLASLDDSYKAISRYDSLDSPKRYKRNKSLPLDNVKSYDVLYDSIRPSYESPTSLYESYKPKYDSPTRLPAYESYQPKFESPKLPAFESYQPKFESPKLPAYESYQPKFESPTRLPVLESYQPKYESPISYQPKYESPSIKYESYKQKYDSPTRLPVFESYQPKYEGKPYEPYVPRSTYQSPGRQVDSTVRYESPIRQYESQRPLYESPRRPEKEEDVKAVPKIPYDRPALLSKQEESVCLSWLPAKIYNLPETARHVSYVVESRELPSQSWKKIATSVMGTTYTARNLNPDTEYEFRVRAQNQHGISEPTWNAVLDKRVDSKSRQVDIPEVRAPPRLPTHRPIITDLGEETVRLAWKPVEPIPAKRLPPVSYRLEAKELPGKDWMPMSDRLRDTTHYLSQLGTDRDYMIRVRAENDYGVSEPTESLWLPRARTFPGVPISRPKIVDYEETRAKLSWSRVDIPTFSLAETPLLYMLEVEEPPKRDWRTIACDLDDTEYIVDGLRPGHDYRFRIRAKAPSGVLSEPSPAVSLYSTLAQGRAPVDRLQMLDWEPDTRSLQLSWDRVHIPPYNMDDEPLMYMVEYNEPPMPDWKPLVTGIPTTRYRVMHLDPQRDYNFRVRALSSYGVSPPSPALPVSLRQPTAARGLPEAVVISEVDSDSLRLTWKRPMHDLDRPISYHVEMLEPPFADWRPIATNILDTTYRVTGLKPTKDYQFRVIPHVGTGYLAPTPSAALTMLPVRPRLPMGEPKLKELSPESVQLSWRPAEIPAYQRKHQPIYYKVEMFEGPTGHWVPVARKLTTPSYTMTGLRPEQEYKFRVFAETDGGLSEPSLPALLHRKPVPHFSSNMPTIRDISQNIVHLSWLPADVRDGAPPVSYLVEMQTPPGVGSWRSLYVNHPAPSVRLADLRPDMDYMVRVRVQSGNYLSEPTLPVYIPRRAAPPRMPHEEPYAVDISSDYVKLQWRSADIPSHIMDYAPITYRLEAQELPDTTWITIQQGIPHTDFKVTGLNPQRDYSFRIRAENEFGLSDATQPMVLRKRSVAPSLPLDEPMLYDVGSGACRLTWRPATLPSYTPTLSTITYTLFVQEYPYKQWRPLVRRIPHTSYYVTGLQPDKEYMFRVQAENEFGTSKPTSAARLPKYSDHMRPVSMPEVSDFDDDLTSVKLRWKPTARGSPITDRRPGKYTVESWEPVRREWKPVARGIPDTTYHVRDLPKIPDHLFRVRLEADDYLSEPSMPVSISKYSLPKVPMYRPQLYEVDNDTVRLSWQPVRLPEGVSMRTVRYVIEQREIPETRWFSVASDVTDTSYKIRGLRAKSDYEFRVKAVVDGTPSDPSSPVSLFRRPVIPKVKFDAPEVYDVDDTSLSLKWNTVDVPAFARDDEPLLFVIERQTLPGYDWQPIASNLTDRSYTVKDLKPYEDYNFRVRGVYPSGYTDPSPYVPVYRRPSEFRIGVDRSSVDYQSSQKYSSLLPTHLPSSSLHATSQAELNKSFDKTRAYSTPPMRRYSVANIYEAREPLFPTEAKFERVPISEPHFKKEDAYVYRKHRTPSVPLPDFKPAYEPMQIPDYESSKTDKKHDLYAWYQTHRRFSEVGLEDRRHSRRNDYLEEQYILERKNELMMDAQRARFRQSSVPTIPRPPIVKSDPIPKYPSVADRYEDIKCPHIVTPGHWAFPKRHSVSLDWEELQILQQKLRTQGAKLSRPRARSEVPKVQRPSLVTQSQEDYFGGTYFKVEDEVKFNDVRSPMYRRSLSQERDPGYFVVSNFSLAIAGIRKPSYTSRTYSPSRERYHVRPASVDYVRPASVDYVRPASVEPKTYVRRSYTPDSKPYKTRSLTPDLYEMRAKSYTPDFYELKEKVRQRSDSLAKDLAKSRYQSPSYKPAVRASVDYGSMSRSSVDYTSRASESRSTMPKSPVRRPQSPPRKQETFVKPRSYSISVPRGDKFNRNIAESRSLITNYERLNVRSRRSSVANVQDNIVIDRSGSVTSTPRGSTSEVKTDRRYSTSHRASVSTDTDHARVASTRASVIQDPRFSTHRRATIASVENSDLHSKLSSLSNNLTSSKSKKKSSRPVMKFKSSRGEGYVV